MGALRDERCGFCGVEMNEGYTVCGSCGAVRVEGRRSKAFLGAALVGGVLGIGGCLLLFLCIAFIFGGGFISIVLGILCSGFLLRLVYKKCHKIYSTESGVYYAKGGVYSR